MAWNYQNWTLLSSNRSLELECFALVEAHREKWKSDANFISCSRVKSFLSRNINILSLDNQYNCSRNYRRHSGRIWIVKRGAQFGSISTFQRPCEIVCNFFSAYATSVVEESRKQSCQSKKWQLAPSTFCQDSIFFFSTFWIFA